MPLYEYQCQGCHETVELLVRSSTEQPVCPRCGSPKLDKQLSVAASPAIAGQSLPTASSTGQPAVALNAVRAVCSTDA